MNDIEYSKKALDSITLAMAYEDFTANGFLFYKPTLFVFEGPVRTGKSTDAIEIFHQRVQNQSAPLALMAARDYDAVKDNLLESPLGLLKRFPKYYKLIRAKIGGYYIISKTNGVHILLAGYSDASKWTKILGKDIETILIDEVNIADETFVNECFVRQGATTHPFTIMTLNGDDPNASIYLNWINKCIIIGDAPASIIKDMSSTPKEKGYYYFHWNFNDNPKLTEDNIRRLKSLYPVGSYYHKTKILGERGKWGITIFADYMTEDLVVDLNEKIDDIPKYNIARYVVGVDIAEGRATNVYSLLGYDRTHTRVYLIDFMAFKSDSKGYAYKTEMLKVFLAKHKGKVIECISVDSAEENFIRDLKGERLGYDVVSSYKATIKARIDLNIILFSKKRFLFDKSTYEAFRAYQSAMWVKGKEGKEREDNNLPMNDIMDSIEYAETVWMKTLAMAENRYKE